MVTTPHAPEVFHIYDTTLRDGAQQEGLRLSVADKLRMAGCLDRLGVTFIEGGWPGANPSDTEFFQRARTELDLQHATLAAFGSTRRAGATAATDPQVQALVDSEAPVVCLVAKSHDRHVTDALKTTLEENLAMVTDTVSHLVEQGRRVFVDCEHFFDGYRANPAYALEVVRAAAEAGAEVVVLCDTNGGMLPEDMGEIVSAVGEVGVGLGIHCHNDSGCAVANSLAAVSAGVMHVQGTVNGYGERTGNADLVSVLANMQLKYGWDLVPDSCLADATAVCHEIAEITNVQLPGRQPYVGSSAFAHKAGLHASAIKVDANMYQHIEPELVGNSMRMLISDMAGRANIQLKGAELGFDLSDREVAARITTTVKQRESVGYSYEASDASFELLLRDELGVLELPFHILDWDVAVRAGRDGKDSTSASVTVSVAGQEASADASGNGPVNALDHALRTVLEPMLPRVGDFELTDYRVRILEQGHGTDATVRVLIDTTDGPHAWTTVGVGENVIEASWEALADAYAFGLIRHA
ncbi:citramalate synthase [Parenemella sanctibonifatiensis]|uniref:Citramalate synthase n=1 Tax=Parenemella sanctibonifatiensis TaxID=2016505 RepID=A0A255EIC0_9ACTN|nr:citramalate synthase [Parenemella sanctibonifatiensis]